ncbi:fumarylacetoacetate hydrolase family protein [Faecalibacter macacae]|uniref:Fumarylacetoacetate hydrolase family protein n=1 Tax=Faecalibacter macacae TaxID=1859289 RepID=A0A3L9MCQ7_9FLAO|nr:fumarylacetoacetate hydrolase family protein [Faecalibacter macacae]RLZ10778.1 fumarylacetoacetate hydrolase family protein [Faecalibacter macacae]
MKFVTYLEQQKEKVGLLIDDSTYDLNQINPNLPQTLTEILADSDFCFPIIHQIQKEISNGNHKKAIILNPQLIAPIPHPPSFRDAYAFRQHVETSRLNRGLEMIPEFDEIPVFYFSNHQAIQGPGKVFAMPEHFNQMDFELEVAIVIKKEGINIKAENADEYIGGFMILNDLSARALQMQEMKLNLGPAKGKDFASMMGPFLVTPDELKSYKVAPKEGHIGNCYDLEMTCSVNDIEVSRGNFKDMHWTFAEIIERVSYGVKIYPGDIIGSGTVGTGCFLELNGTGKRKDENYIPQWLQPNDKIEMEVKELGKLTNSVHLYDDNLNDYARD